MICSYVQKHIAIRKFGCGLLAANSLQALCRFFAGALLPRHFHWNSEIRKNAWWTEWPSNVLTDRLSYSDAWTRLKIVNCQWFLYPKRPHEYRSTIQRTCFLLSCIILTVRNEEWLTFFVKFDDLTKPTRNFLHEKKSKQNKFLTINWQR